MHPRKDKMNKQDGKSLPSKYGFRGFHKVPRVVCERVDAIPFINMGTTTPTTIKINSNEAKEEKVSKLLVQCSVKLIRADPEYFKKLYLKNYKNNVVPKVLKCKICEKIYTSEKRLQKHQENKHMIVIQTAKPQKRVSFSEHVIVHEVKEYHKCRKCPKIFEDYKALKVHMKLVHKKRKCYICFYCSRDFADRMFFKMHIKLHCGKCGVLFPNKTQYSEHKRNVCRDIKKYICKSCPDVFYSFMHLKDHTYQHEGYFVVCDICKEKHSSKCLLAHHIDFLHTPKHRKSLYKVTGDDLKIYECNFCEIRCTDEKFVAQHVSLLPNLKNMKRKGYKDYYFCDQCYERFEIETDMLQHKWKHFLKQDPRENKKLSSLKQTYRLDEELPRYLKPKLILHKLMDSELASYKKPDEKLPINHMLENNSPIIDLTENKSVETIVSAPQVLQNNNPPLLNNINRPKVLYDPNYKRKILFSKHKCEKCGKFFSSNYCLNRHMNTMHGEKVQEGWESLQCPTCEEVFVWPSLLQSHNCIRMNIPEMPFDDARPEVQFDNIHNFGENGFDQFLDHEDYNADFEMPAPIVQLTEYEGYNIVVNDGDRNGDLPSKASKIFIQEVPVEF